MRFSSLDEPQSPRPGSLLQAAFFCAETASKFEQEVLIDAKKNVKINNKKMAMLVSMPRGLGKRFDRKGETKLTGLRAPI